jgi:DNA helicase-2/ATP-dependent DNA helicase PcrA
VFEDLNSQQQKAVNHDEGPLLVFAGAGSGKTRVITYRIARLIYDGVTDPHNILAVTFTRKAAAEMKQRVAKYLRKKAQAEDFSYPRSLPYIGTFHSFGALVLRKESRHVGLPVGFSIYDPNDVQHLIKEIMDDLNIDKKQFNPKRIAGMISSSKNELIGPQEYSKFVKGPMEEVVSEIYPRYQGGLKAQGAVDFDDLQVLPLKLFMENEEVLKKYNKLYRQILVDEYQDTNLIQYKLVKLLAGDHKNICVVGDDDQGIYSWRGATIKNILSFERDFPGAEVVKLEKNYRSTKNILQAAYSLIRNNNERAEKELWTDAGNGKKISIFEARGGKEEAEFVVDKIKSLQRKGIDLKDMAILYRTNAQSRAFEEVLIRNALAYKLIGGARFYERREIKDILAYLRFLANPLDELSFLRIVNVPSRRIGPKSIEEIRAMADNFGGDKLNTGVLMLTLWGMTAEVKDWDQYLPLVDIKKQTIQRMNESPELKEFADDYSEIISLFGRLYELSKKETVSVLINEILERTKYEKWIDDGSPQVEDRKENLFELKVVAEKYSEQGPRDSLLAFLEDVSLVEADINTTEDDDGVTLMTLHSAKGLEFDVVFMTGMEEGLFPHSMSFTSPSELEEERRLCYVGITRAREKLFITFADSRSTYKGFSDRIPSRFISEIPEDIIEVEHYGNTYSW